MDDFTDLPEMQQQILIKLANKNWIGSHQGSETAVDEIILSSTGSETKEEQEEALQAKEALEEKQILISYGSRDVLRINEDWYQDNKDAIQDKKADQRGLDRIERR